MWKKRKKSDVLANIAHVPSFSPKTGQRAKDLAASRHAHWSAHTATKRFPHVASQA
jgi:hypothetical protein